MSGPVAPAVLASALVGAAVTAALAPRSPRALRARLARALPRAAEPSVTAPVRVGSALRRRWPVLSERASRALPGASAEEVDAVLGMQVTAAAMLAGPALFTGGAAVIAVPVAAALGWCAASAMASRRLLARHRRHAASLADVVDLIAVAAGAGLTVFRSLEVAAEAAPPDLRDEVRRVVDGVRCGRPLRQGLADFARRVPLDEVVTFTRAVSDAHRRGLPVVDAAERASDEIRITQRQRAEAAARTAPVKMLFPLAFLILPSFLLLSAAPLLVVALRQVQL